MFFDVVVAVYARKRMYVATCRGICVGWRVGGLYVAMSGRRVTVGVCYGDLGRNHGLVLWSVKR